jgi:hypothetical protein
MGIPKFGAWWLKSFPTSKIVKSKFDILCIDANAMLHQIAQYVYAYHEKSTEQDKEKVISNSFDKNIKLFTYNVINSINEKCKLIFPSTHVVFEGFKELKKDINEDEKTCPILTYASSKAINEEDIKKRVKNYIILRLASVSSFGFKLIVSVVSLLTFNELSFSSYDIFILSRFLFCISINND